jgi:photosystem II stability/assembly factor-like uncharacterized protein
MLGTNRKRIFLFIFYVTISFLIFDNYIFKHSNHDIKKQQPTKVLKGPDCIIDYFTSWHHPENYRLDQYLLEAIWEEINKLPSEEKFPNNNIILKQKSRIGWQCIGPYGMEKNSNPGTYYSGRILDIEPTEEGSIRIASASGGLWEYLLGIFPIPLSDNLETLWTGAFATNPHNRDEIFVGTGETWLNDGMGLWKTNDGGISWSQIIVGFNPGPIYKISFQNQFPERVHFSSLSGYFKSIDSGATFQMKLGGNISDFTICPGNPNLIFAGNWGKWGGGIYQSIDGGDSWTQNTSLGIPTNNVGRVSISAYNENIIYTSISSNDKKELLGVYKTTNGGGAWSTINPGEDIFGGQGWYDNVISVCPTDPDIVLLGGVTFWRSSDGGSNWSKIETPDLHADNHRIRWSEDGNNVWVASDGGLAFSNDKGITWKTDNNWFPITQYVNFDVDREGKNICGGSQDNGISGTIDFGLHWHQYLTGDGGGVAINRNDPSVLFSTLGIYHEDDWKFRRARSTNYGLNWINVDSGIDPSTEWYHKIRYEDFTGYLYNHTNSDVYWSWDKGDNWFKLNETAFPVPRLLNITLSAWPSDSIRNSAVYACLRDTMPIKNGRILRVLDKGEWDERSAGLPTRNWIKKVAVHPHNSDIAYALITGFEPGKKIFKTINRGLNWTNISGNLPNVSMSDLIVHPSYDTILYVGTGFGCYKSYDEGAHWFRWNKGMPKANIITEMSIIDSVRENGKYYIIASTYGRSMWLRNIAEDDLVVTKVKNTSLPTDKYVLNQNYPNPFNPTTTIKYEIQGQALNDKIPVSLRVYDILGREVAILANEQQNPGYYEIEWNASEHPSGIYFYQLSAGSFLETRKMILIK